MGTEEPKNILVIDESQALREAIQEILSHRDFRITATAAGAEARALLESRVEEFDLIIVNLLLPASAGFDVLEWIRAERSRLTMPILALTGPTKMAVTVERLRGIEAAGVQDTRTLWDQLQYRVRGLVFPSAGNQRAAIRVASGLPVNCGLGSIWVQGIIGNISRVGMFVKLEAPPRAGQQVRLQFILPGIPRLFEATARVVWSARRDQGAVVPGMGVEILDLDEAGLSQINAFVRMQLEKFDRIPAD